MREALTAHLVDISEVPGSSQPPSQVNPGTFYLRPRRGRQYVTVRSPETGAWGRPEVNLELVLVAPNGNANPLDWLDDTVAAILPALYSANVGTSALQVEGVSEPGLIGQNNVGVVITLAPFTVTELRYP